MDGFVAKPVALEALARVLTRWLPLGAPSAGAVAAVLPRGELFDPDVLRRMFGSDRGRLAGLVSSFADSIEQDIPALATASAVGDLRASGELAHRIKGGARVAGARALADMAARIEAAARANDAAAVAATLAGLQDLATATLAAARRGLLDS